MSHHHHLELTVSQGPGVLDRVVGSCRSRGGRIVALHFEAGDRHRAGHVLLTLDASNRQAELAAARLKRLVEVHAAHHLGPARLTVAA